MKDADAIEMAVYYEVLAGFPLERVRAAATRWAQTGRFFPTTGEWYELICELREAVPPAAWQPTVTLECEACSDTGFVYRDCVAGARCGAERCLVRGADWSHVYVVRCACFTAEPVNG